MNRRVFCLSLSAPALMLGDDDRAEKELKKLLTNSPWAKEVTATFDRDLTGRSRIRLGGGSRGGGGSEGVGGGESMGRGPGGGGGGGGEGMGPQETIATVRWESAAPILAAVPARPDDPKHQAIAEWSKTHYIVSVSGMPSRGGRGGGGGGGRPGGGGPGGPGGGNPEASQQMAERLRAATSLKVKGRDPMNAANVARVDGEKGQEFLFLFPRTFEISMDDKEVWFETAIGPMVVKAKFQPKQMVHQGKLAL